MGSSVLVRSASRQRAVEGPSRERTTKRKRGFFYIEKMRKRGSEPLRSIPLDPKCENQGFAGPQYSV
jgi:hypothetical protein